MLPTTKRLAPAAVLALGTPPSVAHARGAGAALVGSGVALSFRTGPTISRGALVPFGGFVAPGSAVIVALRQPVFVAPQPFVGVPQPPVFIVPQQPCIACDAFGCFRRTPGVGFDLDGF